ncbi:MULTISPECIES: heat-inducible transcriptional repressor HrcA [Staphylococcus]|uniref:Heat-inducible transcription repressor HrcA n=13 Tax=Staphylococcus chromogenes TaxID=46126 RepID=A0AAJ2K3S2_STACR|nr:MULTISPECIES: heat-inducible transcriptional repressor HrcA [Staphylococcus]KDP12934.1 heat-inducible transcriptional repressor [Staphylococcus chromogenes MU 970]MBP0045729.1 heat-inducible transcription repressor HrcA [Staphylococcus chromogenes]MBV5137093.1 heat-inducible transcriptional repressor HrcA [Staphylococcus chromogenes]MBV5190560.1 heat-inducible transcriptional repressor HrcA [Staphylococcus chromogenes]MBW3132025.1 heat-inducible transcriptional repressor HrcA [Staphylococcu
MITKRQLSILNAIVEDYVELGQPIGSNTIIQRHNVNVSPATIRNDMKLLESKELIVKTHTSSGRIPSEAGFRLYANRLLKQPMKDNKQNNININEMYLKHHFDISSTLDNFAEDFSNQSHYTTLVVGPDHSKVAILDIKLMKVHDYHLIIVLIYETGHVKHLHLSSQTPISSSSVVKLSNFLSLHCVSIVNRTMDIQLQSLDGLSKSEVTFLNQLIDLIHREVASESSRIYLGGKHQLIERLNETNVSAIQTILKYIESNQITDLLDEMVDSSISIKIGHEIEQDVENIAILTRRYEIDHALNGYVAVIGPTAMHYQNVIQLLSRIS